jgi:hypothetical protein
LTWPTSLTAPNPDKPEAKIFRRKATSDRIYRLNRIVWQHRAGKNPEHPVNPVKKFLG